MRTGMIPTNQSAIDMRRILVDSATNPEIRELLLALIYAQQEIDQMMRWRQEWLDNALAQ